MASTNPGLKSKKFHLVKDASKTSKELIFIFADFATSFTKAIFISLCAFSITLEASATFMLLPSKLFRCNF